MIQSTSFSRFDFSRSALVRVSLRLMALGAVVSLAACASSGRPKANPSKEPSKESSTAEIQAGLRAQVPALEQSWVELGPNSHWIVRVATAQATCPEMEIDGHRLPLLERTKAEAQGRSILVCEGDVSPSQKSVTVMGHTHALEFKEIKKIVVIGDTGCRVKAHGEKINIQDCHSGTEWPFAKMLNEVILPLRPDLIVHVGDYHYRESACPEGNTDCDGSIAGDTVESWQQDFFIPAAKALNEANWIFVRGNHEVCKRAGPTWFRFLDAHSYLNKCADQDSDSTLPLSSTLGGVTFSWIDAADDHNIQPSLEKLSERLKTKSFLFMHRPFLIQGEDEEASTENHLPKALLKNHRLTAIVVGHKHKFRINTFSDGRPTEIISGNGGTKLLTHEEGIQLKEGWSASKEAGVNQSTYWRHGFLTLEKHPPKKGRHQMGAQWIAVEHDVEGKSIFSAPLN